MVAVKFYLFFIIISWAIFNLFVVQSMKHQKRPEKSQMQQSTNQDNEKLIEANGNGHVKLLAEE